MGRAGPGSGPGKRGVFPLAWRILARRPGPAEPGPAGLTCSRACIAGGRSPTARLGQKERPPGLGPRESKPELPGGRGPYCMRTTCSGPAAVAGASRLSGPPG